MKRLLATLTLVGTAATIAVLALYLIRTALCLVRADRNLAQVLGSLEQVRDNTVPLGDDLSTINGAAAGLRDQLRSIDSHLTAIVRLAGG